MILTFPQALTTATLDHALRPLLSGRRPPDRRPVNLHLDLAAVECAEFGSLAQLLLVAERAARGGTRLGVDLPVAAPRAGTPGEDAGAGWRRGRCLQMLDATGFTSAIRMPHLPQASVEVRGPAEGTGFDADHPTTAGGDRYLPFRWIPPGTGEPLLQSEALGAVQAGLRDIGLSQRDARLLVDVAVHELVENTAIYAADGLTGPPLHALVGAHLPGPDGPTDPDGTPAHLHDLTRWVTASGSTMIRLVVGDSGAGLVSRLSPHLPRTTAGEVAGRPWAAPGGLGDGTILWAFDRWSTSDPKGTDPRLGTRGLWRVLRLVRTYGGAVLIRSADAFSGYVYGPGDVTEPVRQSGLVPAAGTLVDVTVLPQATRFDPVAVAPRAAGTRLDFRWVPVKADDAKAFDAAYDLAREHDVIVTVDGGMGRSVPHERLVEILRAAARLAAPTVVGVVVTGVNPVRLEAAVDALHHQPAAEAGDQLRGGPFLLIDDTGHSHWCGGAPEVRGLLDELLARERLPVSRSPDAAAMRQLLRDQDRLVEPDGDWVRLSVRPADVIGQLQRMAHEALREAMDRGGPGILRGAYRTPTLRLTDRWFEVDVLVESTIGTATAAFLLMQKLAADVPEALHPDTHIVQVGPVALNLSQTFVESAGLRGSVYVMADQFDAPQGVDRIRAHTQVVLCADILLTENEVRRALAEVLSWGAIPRAIIVPIDARPTDGPIEVYGKVVPVVRLVRAEIQEPRVPADQIVDIDPLLRSPAPDSRAERGRPHIWKPDEFLAGCAEQSRVIGLGHIERSAHGHFTVYLDAGRVIDSDSPLSKQVAEKMTSTVLQWLDETGRATGDRQIVVCYPGGADDYAARFARLIARRLTRSLRARRPVPTLAVPRSVAGSRWAFPDALDPLPPGCDVVLADWGCLNAATMTQLIRLAAEAGAARILGVVLLSQLHDHEERALTMIRSVDGSAADAVPTRVRFLTALEISAVPRGNCPLCRLAAQLSGEADDGLLSPQVAQHARQLARQLTPVTREEAVSRQADAFGVPVRSDEAVEYIRLRGHLVAALRSTSRSQRLADLMAGLAGEPGSPAAHAAVRLLAAERQWLKLPPLRFTGCRSHVAQLACGVARDQAAPERLRLQALVVLATAAPESLVAYLPELWSASLHSSTLLLHIVYQLHHVVRRPPGEIPVSLPDLRAQIVRCREASGPRSATEQQAEEMRWLLTRILFAVDRASVEQETLDAQQAWARLREHYIDMLRHHPDAEAAMIRLLLQMEEPLTRDSGPDEWAVMWRSWLSIEAFLQVHVLPFLPPLSGPLLGTFAEEHFGPAERVWLLADEAARKLTELASALQELHALDLPPQELDMAWSNVAGQLDELRRNVLSVDGDAFRPATLAAFISACPAPLHKTLVRCRDEAHGLELPVDITIEPEHGDEVEVFCHEELLGNAVMQLIDNVVTHRDPDCADRRVDLHILVRPGPDHVTVVCRNTGTRAAARPGKGIASVQRKLRDFDGGLETVDPAEGWSFEAHLRLSRWTTAGGNGARR
ncbi:hypothetical protein [Planosporangium mesophilum]|uniref:Uncharacterized protein n=1 Tax=Planosporangium mesophilum TaxID=689768 RepID=A0A8J3X204_9ACTN|nr:hypothetical protein [Planosporangium mesophilum]NJC85221.1 hypothetical protein [Planosporangium mesophilum]GII24366.1 hypothetical protein Pme01_39630 [Planosporangium mesophilum]